MGRDYHADDARVLRPATFVGGVAEERRESLEVAGVDPVGVAVDDVLDGGPGVRGGHSSTPTAFTGSA